MKKKGRKELSGIRNSTIMKLVNDENVMVKKCRVWDCKMNT